jgi:hypothetical protein
VIKVCTLTGALLALAVAASPAAAMPVGANAKPRILEAGMEQDAMSVRVKLVGRDRDDVVRGTEIEWGEGQPSQGLSSCQRGDKRRLGKKERLNLGYTYPAAGDYTITVRVLSGGCGKRRQQRSAPRTLTVHVG